MLKFEEFINENLKNSDAKFSKLYTRLEYGKIINDDHTTIATEPEYIEYDVIDKYTFARKHVIYSGETDTLDFYITVTLNYKNKPAIILYDRTYNKHDHTHNYSHTGVINPKDFALVAKLGFDGDLNKAVKFLNTKLFSSIRKEIPSESYVVKEAKKFLNEDIENLIESNKIQKLQKNTKSINYSLYYLSDKEAAPKKLSKNVLNAKQKVEMHINAIDAYIKSHLSEVDEKILHYRISKRTNPFRLYLGMNKEGFTGWGAESVFKKSSKSKYDKLFEQINKMYPFLKKICTVEEYIHSDQYDSILFTFDVKDLENLSGKDKNILTSYKGVSKFNL